MPTTASISTQHLTSQAISTERGWFVRRVLSTTAGWASTAARLVLAVVMFPHGAQKLLGWFGGYGFAGTLGFLTGKVGLPTPLAASVILIEFGAPLLLLAGLGTRFAALGIGAVMIGAIATVHASQGFFMNWSGTQAGEGFEYHLLALGLVAVLLVQGGGFMSLDRLLAGRNARTHGA
jgi:putative oxidoreductase